MARKTKTIMITGDNRDQGKSFLITEMPADTAERWALRALMALANSGVEVPEDVMASGMAGMASVGLQMLGKADPTMVLPLLDEMMDCVQFIMPAGGARPLQGGEGADIEEVSTRLQLRKEVLGLHTDFLAAAKAQTTV